MSASAHSTATVLQLVAPDMAQVDLVIADRLASGVPLVGQVAQYIISAGGKRLRPVLLLLTCGVYGNVVRFLAPITIPDAHFAEAMDILEESVAAARQG